MFHDSRIFRDYFRMTEQEGGEAWMSGGQPGGVPGRGGIAEAGWRRHVTGQTSSDAALGLSARRHLSTSGWPQKPPRDLTIRD